MLRRGLQRGLRPLTGSGRAAYSPSATVNATGVALTTAENKGGFLSSLFGGSSSVGVPLTDPFPGVVIPEPITPPATKPTTKLATLPNGFKIASEATVGPTVSIGLYVDAGSVYEGPQNAGVSHLLEYMAFKSTTNRTHFRLVREVEAIGANVLASASREQMAYAIDAVSINLPEALEVLADAVLNPAFHGWEVKQQLEKLENDIKGINDNPQTLLMEALHSCAYKGALGRPLVCPSEHVGLLNADVLQEFTSTLYTPGRMVLAAAGVDQDHLVNLATPIFGDLAAGPAFPEPKSEYVGGDFRQYSASPLTHVVMAFEYQGGWNNIKGATAVTVLQYLLGGGGSFSAGGPGKGMHSRLYTRVLNRHGWVHNCTAINSVYNNTGLVGIFASAESSRVEELISVLTSELQAVATSVTAEELDRAKKATISTVLMNLESRAVVAEDIGRQVLTYGHRKPEMEFIDEIQKLTPNDITATVSKILKTPVSLAILGDVVNAPRYDAVAKKFA